MVLPHRLWKVAVCAALLTACAAPGPARPQPSPVSAEIPSAPTETAPYVDVSVRHPPLGSVVAKTPTRRFVLAFMLAKHSACAPAWAGSTPIDDPAVLGDIAAVRSAGGSVTLASGGATGTYLENACSTAAELAGAYRQALQTTGADRLELDVETAVRPDVVADALRIVHTELAVPVTITATVADAGSGLEQSTLDLLRALASRGTDVVVNAMVMNFPESGSWRESMLTAATTVAGQTGEIWPGNPYSRLGITYMAGRNDTGVLTTVDDAHALRDYAVAHAIAFLGFWSLARDNGNCADEVRASPVCSGLAQETYAFTRALRGR
ncbi:carbohydrate-binding protein CenC [Amycolatopsis acidiphila]|uniref:Carbohydrate-binding protein CenC n=1 Tax=Amycolatopsis acidiphila TaxID=715473 RepID=A0A557ZYU9_9PSEU|nr:carbohydrate-binding protein CenC [Amycolatopsis acidiphila]TVT17180.1 carbohydrate-binding protein CenC [Amycolatopsis acidiphila]UIJ63057.1 carbohydrate-binding protein CenC [Amycolatopsis acidiphila]GHG65892.1 hypothetical protein GCM10017788_23710 [Amycolatopsis acidiphila]